MPKKIIPYLNEERNPDWIELFFDLAFVAVLGKIVHILFHTHNGHIELQSFVNFITLTILMFWVWLQYTFFLNKYANGSLIQSIITIIIMGLMLIFALYIDDIESSFYIIPLILGLISFFLALLYINDYNLLEGNQSISKIRIISYLIYTAGGFIIFIFFKDIKPIIIVILTALSHIITNQLIKRKFSKDVAPDFEHLLERLGIFTILLLGETIVTFINIVEAPPTYYDIISIFVMLLFLYNFFYRHFINYNELEEKGIEELNFYLLPTLIAKVSLLLLPVIIYHTFVGDLVLSQYKILVFITISMFSLGNFFTYKRRGYNFRLIGVIITATIITINGILLLFVNTKISALFIFTIVNTLFYLSFVYLIPWFDKEVLGK